MNPTDTLAHQVVSKSQWLLTHGEFLAKEKELTHLSDELARQRRELPWTRVEKDYVFAGPQGKLRLADLFDGRSQLATYHFMFGPDWQEGCPSCSFNMDHTDCSNAWGSYLNGSLRSLITTGKGRPNQKEKEGAKKASL